METRFPSSFPKWFGKPFPANFPWAGDGAPQGAGADWTADVQPALASCWEHMKKIPFIPGVLMKPHFSPGQFSKEKLRFWLSQPRIPLLASNDPMVAMFIQGMLTGERVNFIYIGGSKPGASRAINVSLVFQHPEYRRIYIAGYCHARGANRVFSLDRTMVIHACN